MYMYIADCDVCQYTHMYSSLCHRCIHVHMYVVSLPWPSPSFKYEFTCYQVEMLDLLFALLCVCIGDFELSDLKLPW